MSVQCAFLDWPKDLNQKLADWTNRNYAASLVQDKQSMSEIAREFQAIIDEMCRTRLESKARPEDDVTASLMHKKISGRFIMTGREFKDFTFHHLANVINSFASPKRLEIIDILSQGEKDVDTLTKETNMNDVNSWRFARLKIEKGFIENQI